MQTSLQLNDPDVIELAFDAVRVRQPIGDIYVASIDHISIQRLSRFDVRRRIEDERDVERYLGIQRPLNPRRVQDLHNYVNFRDATFPSSVIVAVESDYARFEESEGKIIFSNTRAGDSAPSTAIANLMRVIDGQHRIAGLEKLNRPPFDIIASVFIGSDIADQAYVFATVNLEQTKVNRSLAIDLFDLAKTRSPYKTCHNIAIAFDETDGSPFFKRIKRLGVATEGRGSSETLTQATFVDGLLPYISRRPKEDRDFLLRDRNLVRASGAELDNLVFRNLFIEGNDLKIGRMHENYFRAISENWDIAWNNFGFGSMIARTNGYRAFSSIFGRIYRKITAPGNDCSKDAFRRELLRSSLRNEDFNTDRFKPGTSGESDLRQTLIRDLNLY